jgi:orotate phosphoribosyltransferase
VIFVDKKVLTVSLPDNPTISVNVIPGHYATNRFHVTHYLKLSSLKTNANLAREVARDLAIPYRSTTLVDTILCMERTEIVGAYLAQELLTEGTSLMNSGREIHVLRPRLNVNRKLIFTSNLEELILNKNVLLLVSAIATGITLDKTLEFINYYGGKVIGISALFSAQPQLDDQKIHSMFTSEDIEGYQIFDQDKCPMCKKGEKLEAIIVDNDYKKL